MNRVFYLIWAVAGLLVLCAFGCAGFRATKAHPALQEEFDPEVLNDDDISVRPDLPPLASSSMASDPAPGEADTRPTAAPDTATSDSEALVPGYRVQIATTLKQETAERLREEVSSRLDVRAYVEYAPEISPFYKIRVGDCTTKEDAEGLRKRAEDAGYKVSRGYPAPFWVETKVWPVALAESFEPAVRRVEVPGYRVQLFAGENRGDALRVEERARQKFDAEVYSDFFAPLYKVRVGDCRTMEEADVLLKEAKRKGYGDAFRIPTKIWVEQVPEPAQEPVTDENME